MSKPVAVWALLLAAASLGHAASVALRVAPAFLQLEVERGKQYDFTVSVGNAGYEAMAVEVAPCGLTLTPDGLPVPVAQEPCPHSCAPWLSVTPDRIRIEPGQVAVAKVTLKVPGGARGGRYGVIAFRTPLGSAPGETPGTTVAVEGATGCVLMLTVKGPSTIRGEVEEVCAVVDRGAAVADFSVGVRNTGDVHFRCSGQLVVYGPDRRVAARLEMDAGTGTVLPQGVRNLKATWQLPRDPTPGSYRAEARLTIPGARSLRSECRFELP